MFFVGLSFLAVLLLANNRQLLAQDLDEDKQSTPLTRSMEAFLEDKLPPEDLEAMNATPCVGGLAGSYPCENIDLLAFMPLSTFSAGSGNDSWGWTDPLDGTEYAIMGLNTGTAFVDISDPENPLYLGILPTHTSNSSWRDIKVYANHAFVVSEAGGHGMQVFDLTELRNVPSPPATFAETAHFGNFGSAHNIVINEDSGYAYAVGASTCSGGLHMINIQNPATPTDAGCFSGDGYTHDAQCVNYAGPDPDHQGKEICFNSNEDTLTIVDVTNKAAPVQLSRTGYAGSGYTHQGWLTEDHTYFLLDDELDEINSGHHTRTRIWDVSNLDAPVIIDYHDGRTTSIDHNMYVHQGLVYQANYRSGLSILDLTDVASGTLEEVGYFDIYPSSDSASFNGAWSTYPYFDSGVVVISGIEQGLFLVQPTLAPDFQMQTSDDSLAICMDGSDNATLELLSKNGYTNTVTLSAQALPAGANGAFSDNPIIPPATSLLTVTTSGTAAGSYAFNVLGTDGTLSHTLDLSLSVFDASPGIPTLFNPPDGAVDVSLAPLLDWSAASQSLTYTIEIADSVDFTNIIYSAVAAGSSHQVTTALDPLSQYFWRVMATNTCGDGGVSAIFSFTTIDIPPILLVDDDDNSPDVQPTYTGDLDALVGAGGYDIWDTGNSDNEPDATTLSAYQAVIWFTGEEFGGFAGPGSAGEASLSTWLNGGGCLLISSQDYYYDRGLTAFMQGYLGVASATSDVGQDIVTGAGSVFNGLGPYNLSYPFTNYSDIVNPDGTAELAFSGDAGNAAVDKIGGNYLTTFLGFPLEAIPSANDRLAVLTSFLGQCTGGGAADISVTPSSMEVITYPNRLVEDDLTIENLGSVDLIWTVSESSSGDCDLVDDIPWVSTSTNNGTTPPAGTDVVGLAFDTSGMNLGLYSGSLCIQSNDNINPTVNVPLSLIVAPYQAFIPAIHGD